MEITVNSNSNDNNGNNGNDNNGNNDAGVIRPESIRNIDHDHAPITRTFQEPSVAQVMGNTQAQRTMRPNPNLQPKATVKETLTPTPETVHEAQQNILDSEEEKNTVKDLQDLLSEHDVIKVTARLLVKVLFTRPEFSSINQVAQNDISNDDTSGGQTLNFYSPLVMAKDDQSQGFLRRPIVDLIRYLSSSNVRDYYALSESSNQVERLIAFLDKGAARVIYNQFGGNDIVTYLVDEDADVNAGDDEEGEEGEGAEYLSASDFVSVNSWNSLSFEPTGAVNVNYTVSLNIHALDIYSDDTEDKFKIFNRIKKFILRAVDKSEATTLTVSLAAVFDNKILADADFRDFMEEFFPKEAEENTVEEFEFLTHDTLLDSAVAKEEILSSMEENSARTWMEGEELYPSNANDVDLMLEKSEIMFISTLVENEDSITSEDESEE